MHASRLAVKWFLVAARNHRCALALAKRRPELVIDLLSGESAVAQASDVVGRGALQAFRERGLGLHGKLVDFQT
jgi:hypothetical protein